MKGLKLLMQHLGENRGATIIIVAIMIMVFLGFAALAVDLGYVMVTKNELQNVSDSAALAATRQLGHDYELMSPAQQIAYVCDPAPIIATAQSAALQNKAAGLNIVVNDGDVVIGQWDAKTKTLTPTLNQPDAVQVTARRDGQVNNPITTFFARVFNQDTVAVTARATAALTGLGTVEPGTLIPVGISEQWFYKPIFCNQPIKFYPTNSPEGCAGWNTFDNWPASESYLRKTILQGMYDGSYPVPDAKVGEDFVFIGGTLGNNTFQAFLDLYNKNKDADGNWKTTVVVYRSDSCSNPSGNLEIVGFASATITKVLPPPDQTIDAIVTCQLLKPGRGSGGEYGTRGTIPGLVQ